MTRSQLIKTLAMQNKQLLLSGQRVEVRGFGSFVLRLRAARSVRNPKTGAVAHQKPSYVLHFKPGKALRERVNHVLAEG